MYSYTYNPDEPVKHEGCCRVVCPVVEGRRGLVLPGVVALLEVGAPTRVQGADGLGGQKRVLTKMS